MFVTKKFHDAQVAFLTSQLEKITGLSLEQQEILRRGYHSRIEALEAHISDLQRLVFPKNSSEVVSPQLLELDNAISVSEKPPEVSEKDHNRALEGESDRAGALRELDLLVSGNYDLDLMVDSG